MPYFVSTMKVIFALLTFVVSTSHGSLGLRPPVRQLTTGASDPTDDQTVHCRIVAVDVQKGAGSRDKGTRDFRCVTRSEDEEDGEVDMTYHIEIPTDQISHHDLALNKLELTITHVNKTRTPGTLEDAIILTKYSEIKVQSSDIRKRDRRLYQTKGTNLKFLVVRVNGNDVSPTLSTATLSDKFFGTAGDTVTLSNVYKQCSHGKLTFSPASGNGITDGVGEITLNIPVTGVSPWALENTVTSAATAKFGALSQFAHGTSYPGVGTDWAAYGFIGEYRTFYNDLWCSYVSAQVHEVGHNLNLDHSNEDGDYGDGSAIMGFSYPYDDFPTMCFNGAKHWVLGWYDDRKIEIDASQGWAGNIIAFVDAPSATGNDVVIIKVDNYYIQYNRAKGINSGTQEKRDELTVTQTNNLKSTSESITGLSATNKIFIFQHAKGPARVEFCQALKDASGVDRVQVSVYLESAGSGCNSVTLEQRSVPITPPPTPAPTLRPTAKPTIALPTPNAVNSVAKKTGGFCFSGDTTVQVKEKGTIMMKNLKIGDEVLVATGKYEPVYSFGHRHESMEADFLQFLPSGLELSADHMVRAGGRFIPASMVKVGDDLVSTDGNVVSVEAIKRVTRMGVYAPFTMSGTIVVSNIEASNYVAFRNSDRLVVGKSRGWETPMSFQWVAHLSQAPHRISWLLGFSGAAEEYSSNGMSTWIAGPHQLAEWVVEQNSVVMALLVLPALGVGLMSSGVEWLISCFC